MNKKEVVSLIILFVVISYGIFRYVTRSYSIEKSQYLMDTIVKISGTSKSKDIGKKIDMVFEYIKELEQLLDEYKEGSWVWNVNNTDKYQYPMHPEIYSLLTMADSLYRYSDGKFDITIKPVYDLWQFNSPNPAKPDFKDIKSKISLVGFNKLRYNENYLFKPKGVQLTFGALAKGYIVDKAREFMKSLDVDKGYIDCSSSMTFYGNKILPEIVGIQHPRNMNSVISVLHLRDTSVGTSGDYQQYFEYDGHRYHHILDARTGYPVENVFSVTVINPSALVADGFSTLLFLMKPDSAITFIKQFPNTDAIIYYQDNNSILSLRSEGMKNYLQNENGE